MNKLRNRKRSSNKDLIYKALIFLATVTVIVYFLPRSGKFNYQFDIDKPWKYGLLTAPFDFPVYKDEALVKQEQDSMMKFYQPYFFYNQRMEQKALSKLNADFNHGLKSKALSPFYFQHVNVVLKQIYKAGVVTSAEMTNLKNSHIRSVMLAKEMMANAKPSNELFTIKTAYEYLLNADTIHFSKEILRQCDLDNYIIPNLRLDKKKSDEVKKELLGTVSWASGLVQSGQKIIDRGEIVNDRTFRILESLKKESIKRSGSIDQQRLIVGGQILFVGMLMLYFMLYLDLFRKDYYQHKGGLSLLFAVTIFFSVLTALMVKYSIFNVYMVPYAMLPIVIRVFLDSRTAFMTHTVTILICSITLRFPFEFILLQFVAGFVAIYSLRELSQRSHLFRTAFLIVLSYAALNFSLELIHENDISKINLSMYMNFAINGILLLFAYPFLFLLEKTFGFTSNVTLVELSNINNRLLRKLSEVAPGTFQHSMQVANLAAEAAIRIGGKSQLVRTGALYHDIGKLENPAFFTENQSGVNPHKALSYEQSAQVVINHVHDGLKLAEKNNLPKVIKDFISTHHGTGKTKYFYVSYKNENPDKEIDEEVFTYPGPNPFSKETAILMMADSVEAASRSLPEYTEESISNLVDKIIDSQVEDGFFKYCPITFKDIATVKCVFKEKLRTIYHTRVSYPELKRKGIM
ncbi:HDIG domain-containing metalloprotein [uncultured Bacteroides sp.]|uniref:HD family phosphohydrolase n=1 Tax=uncultured Bacteroides sp. TaxID=162156 RepID=UPI002AABC6AD|nr:HDIG domain-containing metalloprotein [uncultured Bacteroides sp.]